MTDTAKQLARARWAGGACPFEAGWRKVMMWAFIITDGLLFAGFLASYGFARLSHHDWPDQGALFNLTFIATMTFVLITSSATMASAVRAAEIGSRKVAERFLWATALGGLIFLAMQAKEWATLIEEGVRLASNPFGASLFGAYFFLITGFHGTHVLSGVIILVATALRWRRGITQAEGVEMAGLYWHFVDLVWVFIFTVFYLI